jgi:ADP-ribose pyrophosphatase
MALRADEVVMPGGREARREIIEHAGAVAIAALDPDDRIMMIYQYRHALGRRLWEMPAGLLDVEGEDPLVAAQRELREEALLLADRWTHLFTTYSSPGISSEKIAYYLAQGLSEAPDRGGFEPAHEEADMTTAWVSVDDLVEGVREGRITDGPTAQAVLGYRLFVQNAG